jgi:hypothetical protein
LNTSGANEFRISPKKFLSLSLIPECICTPYGGDSVSSVVSADPTCDSADTFYKRGVYKLPLSLQIGIASIPAVPPQEWQIFQDMTFVELSLVLKHLAAQVSLRAFRRHPRGPKKAQQKRTFLKRKPHVSTAKILAQK